MDTRLIHCFFLVTFSLGCSSDEEKIDNRFEFTDIQGTVLHSVSCTTDNNGLAYEIEIDTPNFRETIITASLPAQFKENGLRIKFDMENSLDGFGFCVMIYGPDMFYEIGNVVLAP